MAEIGAKEDGTFSARDCRKAWRRTSRGKQADYISQSSLRSLASIPLTESTVGGEGREHTRGDGVVRPLDEFFGVAMTSVPR